MSLNCALLKALGGACSCTEIGKGWNNGIAITTSYSYDIATTLLWTAAPISASSALSHPIIFQIPLPYWRPPPGKNATLTFRFRKILNLLSHLLSKYNFIIITTPATEDRAGCCATRGMNEFTACHNVTTLFPWLLPNGSVWHHALHKLQYKNGTRPPIRFATERKYKMK